MPTQEQIERAARLIRDEVAARLGEASGREMTEGIARAALVAAMPTAEEHTRGVEAALRAECQGACSYASRGVAGHSCHGECKRPLSDFPAEDVARIRSAIGAHLAVTWGADG